MRSSVGALCAAALVWFASVACSSPPASQAVVSPTAEVTPSLLPDTGPTPSPSPEPTPSVDPLVPVFANFDPAHFTNGAVIDNEWLPLQAGRQWIEDGVTLEGDERIPHRITFTVTDLTKMIAGVQTVVVWVEDYSDGVLVEKEIAFYAQDDDGTVWYFGEHPEEYEDGEFVTAPTWIAGLQEARAGVKVFAEPKVGDQTYYQGWAPAVEWSDFGRVDETGLEDCVTAGCYPDVIRFAESSIGEEGIFQLKSYARGVGEVRTGWRGDPESREELELKSTATLTGASLAKYRQMALDLEKHAYEISPDLYGKTEPSK